MLAQKDREEYQLKEERRLKAQNDLQAWHSQRQQEILKRREINFAAEQNFRDLQESFKAVRLVRQYLEGEPMGEGGWKHRDQGWQLPGH